MKFMNRTLMALKALVLASLMAMALPSVVLVPAVMMPTAAHADALTDFAENKQVDALIRGQALGAPATWYLGLDTGACTEAGGGTEVTGGSYARSAVVASLANFSGTQSAGSTTVSSGTAALTSNNASVPFVTPTAGWGTVLSVRWWDASTGGNAWICKTLTLSKVINTGDTVTFPAASLSFTADN